MRATGTIFIVETINNKNDKNQITTYTVPLTIGGTVLKECDDLYILGVTFDSKMTFKKHLRSVSLAASQRLGVLRKSWRVFMVDLFLGDAFGVCPARFGVLFCCVVLGCRYTT